MVINNMRGEKYEKDTFIEEGYNFSGFILCILCGVFTIIISIIDLYTSKNNISDFSFTRLLYKIANIGLNKEEKDDE